MFCLVKVEVEIEIRFVVVSGSDRELLESLGTLVDCFVCCGEIGKLTSSVPLIANTESCSQSSSRPDHCGLLQSD